MKKIGSRVITAVLAAALCLGLVAAVGGSKVHAENFQFITGISLAYGEGTYEELEEAGFRVMGVGLNYGVDDANQIYLGYLINEGAPVTDVVITADAGDQFVSEEGIQYQAAGGPDVDQGTGAAGGILYYTTDPAAGEPLVGLDILRQDITDGRELLAIQNDGSEVVRNSEGMPADLEAGDGGIIIYLMKIRDHIVRPYISEIITITGEDRQSAVYEAAVRGYNYFIDGDIDEDPSTYTILAYERTADSEEAITNIVGVSEALRSVLVEKQVIPGSEADRKDKESSEEEEVDLESEIEESDEEDEITVTPKPERPDAQIRDEEPETDDMGTPEDIEDAEDTEDIENTEDTETNDPDTWEEPTDPNEEEFFVFEDEEPADPDNAEKDANLSSMNLQAAEKEPTLSSMNLQTAEKEANLSSMNLQTAEKDANLSSMNLQTVEQETYIPSKRLKNPEFMPAVSAVMRDPADPDEDMEILGPEEEDQDPQNTDPEDDPYDPYDDMELTDPDPEEQITPGPEYDDPVLTATPTPEAAPIRTITPEPEEDDPAGDPDDEGSGTVTGIVGRGGSRADQEEDAEMEDAETEEDAEKDEDLFRKEAEESDETGMKTLLTSQALDISGIEYVRVNEEPIPGNTRWNLYVTHNSKAGNPVSMLYAETAEEGKRTFFGMWADGFFAAKGTTRAYTYVVNEDLLAELQEDRTVYAELPVQLLDGTWNEKSGKADVETLENALMLSLLTQKDGLPEGRLVVNGLKEVEEEAPVIDRTDIDSERNGITSTAFEDRGNKFLIIGIAAGAAMIVSAGAVVLYRRKGKKEAGRNKGGGENA